MIAQILEASTEIIGKNIDGLQQCEVYSGQFSSTDTSRTSIKVPACFITSVGADASQDPGTGQLALEANFMAMVLTKDNTARFKPSHAAISLAEAIALEIRMNRWGLSNVGVARVTRVVNIHDLTFDSLGLTSWRIEWNQEVILGESIWVAESIPCVVWLGMAPEIGIDHVDDYDEIYRDNDRCPE